MNQDASQQTQYPTSPWTDVYQTTWATTENAMPVSQFDAEDQQPTHDALSDAYLN